MSTARRGRGGVRCPWNDACMPSTDETRESLAGYLAEFDFIREGMRQDQRERQAFLGFALAASGLILGLLMRADPPRSPTQVCFLVGLAAGVTLVAERLTIRASRGVASAGAYLRVFVEPHVEGLEYQGRNPSYIKKMRGAASASRGLGLAYVGLTVAFILAWFAAPVDGSREWWQTGAVGFIGAASCSQAFRLIWTSLFGWSEIDKAWADVATEEQTRAAHRSHPEDRCTANSA